MLLYFPALFYALIYFVVLQLISYGQGVSFYLLLILIIYTFFGARKISNKWIFAIIPTIFAISSAGLLFLISSFNYAQIFIAISTGVYYMALFSGYKLSRSPGSQFATGVLAAVISVTAFFFYASSYGIYLNFVIPLSFLMAAYFTATFLISYPYFKVIDRDNKKSSLIYSMLLGLIMAEIAWMVNFWPFGYLTTGVTILIFYYILWDLTQNYFLDILSKKRVLINILFLGFLVGSVLSSAKWLPNI